MPFPVQVVERVETHDRISRNRFVTRYAYHHGYFDGIEREFRGFGMVEQWDTEEFAALNASGAFPDATNVDEASHVPPVLTKTWFHTGVYIGRNHVSNFFAGLLDGEDVGEYYREPDLDDDEARALLLEDTVLPDSLSTAEEREACRALKGSILRQEIYALDGTADADRPYTVSERNYTLNRLQLRGENEHAVFFAHPRETIDFHYERNPSDPRISHSLVLEADEYGNVKKALAIGYGRRPGHSPLQGSDRDKQEQLLITYTENDFTNVVEEADAYRAPLPCETSTYELTRFELSTGAQRFRFTDFVDDSAPDRFAPVRAVAEINYEDIADGTTKQKRLIEQMRTYYRPDDLGSSQDDSEVLLPLQVLESMALPGDSYKLAFTPGLLSQVYQRGTENLLPDPASVLSGTGGDRGGYVDLDGSGNWWVPSGRLFYHPDPNATPAQELADARQHFFLARRVADPFEHSTVVDYGHDLLPTQTTDALQNTVTAVNDYRGLQPRMVTDPNGNRSEVAFDGLGMVVGTAVMAKVGENLGDSLDGFDADLTDSTVAMHLQNPFANPHGILQRATTRLVYDLFAYQRTQADAQPQPPVVYTLVRETHDADLSSGQQTKIQHSFSYSDGFGREIQKKIQAEPGEVSGVHTDHRWVGSGWTVFNNKGKPVRQYEPFFTDTHRFEFGMEIGVSPILFYDPVERVVATLHPNHTWEKVVFDPWRQTTYDANDTVLAADPKTDPDVGEFFRRLPDADYLPTWHAQREGGGLGPQEQAAARKAAIHADTPTVAHLDSLGRAFLTVAHNRFKHSNPPPADPPVEEFYRTRAVFDIEGNQREVIDAKDRVVMRYDYSIMGPEENEDEDTTDNRIHQASMEAGERWTLNDVAGNPIRAWDSRGHEFRTAYDELRRPTESYLGEDVMVERTIYGETQPNPESSNMRGQVVQLFDQAGMVTTDNYDFKGNVLSSCRQLAQEYKTTLDWSDGVPLESETYTSRTRYDALNRPIQLIAPHSDQPETKINVTQPVYKEANLLEQVNAWVNEDAEPSDLLNPATANLNAVTNINYDAKGQREQIEYGNGVVTTYEYDPLTFRLVHLQTVRNTERLQDLFYTYDPVGNIVHIRDDAQQTIYFNNAVAEPHADYTYDALYRLIEATGREHIGQVGRPVPSSWNDEFRVKLPHPHDGQAMRHYTERYEYDEVGNFKTLRHIANGGSWTRHYYYEEDSLTEAGKQSNRLTRTVVGNDQNHAEISTETYTYEPHGNMLNMLHLQVMGWDFKDQLQMTQRRAADNADEEELQRQDERTYYVYDASGQRVRKVTENAAGQVKDERIYLNSFEAYRTQRVNTLVRETLHIMEDKQRIALVETRTQGMEPGVPKQLIRYQCGNHLGLVRLELDTQGQIISYEEYTPYGSTSYQAVRSQTEAPKQYHFAGKERDQENGLYYHGARYYASWLGRWTSPDPDYFVDGFNLYTYVSNDPVGYDDPTGRGKAGAAVKVAKALADTGYKVGKRSMTHVKRFGGKKVDTKMLREATSVSKDLLKRLDDKFPGLQVPYTKEGLVQFSKATHKGSRKVVKDTVDIGEFKDEATDIGDAWKQHAQKKKLTPKEVEKLKQDYTMHHDYEKGKLQLVDADVHNAYRHTGGNALQKAGLLSAIGAALFPRTSEAKGFSETSRGLLSDVFSLVNPVEDAIDLVDAAEAGGEYAVEKVLTIEDDTGMTLYEALRQLPYRMMGY